MIPSLPLEDLLLLSSSLFSSGLIILAGILYLRGSKMEAITEPLYEGFRETNMLLPPSSTSPIILPSIPRSPVSQSHIRLLLEREILSHAVTRIYEAEAEGKISLEERDRMVERYEKELKRINMALAEIEKQARLEDLEREKEQLRVLIDARIKDIEKDIERLKMETGLLPKAKRKAKPGKGEKVEKRRVKKEKKPSDLESIMERMMAVMKEMEKIEKGEE